MIQIPAPLLTICAIQNMQETIMLTDHSERTKGGKDGKGPAQHWTQCLLGRAKGNEDGKARITEAGTSTQAAGTTLQAPVRSHCGDCPQPHTAAPLSSVAGVDGDEQGCMNKIDGRARGYKVESDK